MYLSTLLKRHAQTYPKRTALAFRDQSFDYASLKGRVDHLANALRACGLQKGDRFVTLMDNSPEFYQLYWVAAQTGMVIVPMSPLLTSEGLYGLVNDCGAKAFVCDSTYASNYLEVEDKIEGDLALLLNGDITDATPGFKNIWDVAGSYTDPNADARGEEPLIGKDDIFNIIYSSGTTGDPKGIIHTHGIRQQYGSLFANSWRIDDDSVVMHSGSLVFNGAFLMMMPAMCQGAKFVLQDHAKIEETIETIASEKVTHMVMVPSQIVGLLNSPAFDVRKLESLRTIVSVGAPMMLEHKEELERRLPGRYNELYGLTEGFVTILSHRDFLSKPGSVGAPPPFYDMKIVDDEGNEVPRGTVGEIMGRGPIMMPGYWGRDDLTEATIKGSWLVTGDMGYVDDQNFLFLVDRKKDMIISGGVNIYPRDIEEIASRHPEVQECAVFGVPSDKWGERPEAAVVLREGASLTADGLCAWINEQVASKIQRVGGVHVMSSFPRNVAGKTLKRQLREMLHS